MTILLVRHAQSAGNAAGVLSGAADLPLTDLGRAQAAALGERLTSLSIAAVYASPLTRARDTAQATADRVGLPVTIVDGLREASLGAAEGLSWAEIRERWTLGSGATWADAIPGAEPGGEVRARVSATIDELLERHPDEVVLCVSHAGTITHALQHVLGTPLDVGLRFTVYHAALNVIEQSRSGPVLLTLNDRCHLELLDA